ncbi:MAG: hypothetical protein WDM76_18645 [Limisphaerales bacterium]
MSLRVVITPEAAADILNARTWYDSHETGVGDKFYFAFCNRIHDALGTPFLPRAWGRRENSQGSDSQIPLFHLLRNHRRRIAGSCRGSRCARSKILKLPTSAKKSCLSSSHQTQKFSFKASLAVFGAKHAQLSIDYGTHVVAGVTPGKGGQFFEHGGKKVPIFDTVADAVKQTGATASAVFVPPALRRRCDS